MYLSKMLRKQFSNIISNWFELNLPQQTHKISTRSTHLFLQSQIKLLRARTLENVYLTKSNDSFIKRPLVKFLIPNFKGQF